MAALAPAIAAAAKPTGFLRARRLPGLVVFIFGFLRSFGVVDFVFGVVAVAALAGVQRRAAITFVLVTHDLELARACDDAVWVHEGRVRAVGPAGEVVDAYAAFLDEAVAAESAVPAAGDPAAGNPAGASVEARP